MKKSIVIVILTACAVAGFYCTGVDNKATATQQVKVLYTQYVDSFIAAVDVFAKTAGDQASQQQLQAAFFQARKAYKKVETFAEYYNPATAKSINGPALDEVEPDNPAYPEPPHGFQVIEEMLFPVYDSKLYENLTAEAAALVASATRLKKVNETLTFTDRHIFDAIRLELFRIETLALAGFDTPVSLVAISEIPATLQSLQYYLACFAENANEPAYLRLSNAMQDAQQYAAKYADFNAFDRALFITAYMNPLTRNLNAFQQAAGVAYFTEPRPLAANAATLFDSGVFNPYYYTGTHRDSATPAMVELGKLLFHEVRLSGNSRRSCAGCHAAEKFFTDGLAKSKSFDGNSVIMRNTPTILYAGLQPALFADLRLVYLEDQAGQVIQNPDEMHGNLQHAVQALSGDTTYRYAFDAAFGKQGLSPNNIQKALAAYIRTKNAFNSRFDVYMRGDTTDMSRQEIAGFNLFMGKAKCGTCHFMPLFNGTVPPGYLTIESEVLGVPAQPGPPYTLDADAGRHNTIPAAPYLHAFKTPTVRNSSATAPYMHNGVYPTLESVIDFYNKGGGAGLGLAVDNQTLPEDQLDLSLEEQQQLVAFIKALSDTSY